MIFGFVALLIAGLAFWFYRTGGTMTSTAPSAVDAKIADDSAMTGAKTVTYGGTIFVTEPSQKMIDAAKGGATAYTLDSPASAQRRADALNRAQALEALKLQSHLTQQVGNNVPSPEGNISNYQPGVSTNVGDNTAIKPSAQYWDSRTQTWVDVSDRLAPVVGPMQIA
jgi:hypothetical protein